MTKETKNAVGCMENEHRRKMSEAGEPVMIGHGGFGDIYDWAGRDQREAFDFLVENESGDLLNVFYRDDIGGIDLVWGDKSGGLCHIIDKHVGYSKDGVSKDFSTIGDLVEHMVRVLDSANDNITTYRENKYVVERDGFRVVVSNDYQGESKNWVITAVDYNRSTKEKGIATNHSLDSHGAKGAESDASRNSKGKGSEKNGTTKENGEKNEGNLVFREAEDDERRIDDEYFAAMERGDESGMRAALDEMAKLRGYDSDESWRYYATAPVGGVVADDGTLYTWTLADEVADNPNRANHISDSYYSSADVNGSRDESMSAIQKAMDAIRRGKDPMVTIYRAVPKGVKEGKVRVGDWVTLSRAYAEKHGDGNIAGDYRVIEERVPASQLYWDGNDINEWGFDDGKEYKYKNTENNRKLNDLVTRDDDGNVIPPSRRFDEENSDVRFREAEDEEPTRPSGPLREGEGIFDRAEDISRRSQAEREAREETDEELVERRRAIDEITPTDVARATEAVEAQTGKPFELSKNAVKEVYKGIGQVENKRDHHKVAFYNNTFKKCYLMDGDLFLRVVPALRDAFENSVLAYTDEHDKYVGQYRGNGSVHKAHGNIKAWHNYIGKVAMDGEVYYIRFTTTEDNGSKRGMHSMQVSSIRIYDEKTSHSHDLIGPHQIRGLGHQWDVDANLQSFFDRAKKAEENLRKNNSQGENEGNLRFREEEPRGVKRAAIYGKDRRTGETRYVDYSRTGDEVREIERDVVQEIKERHPELKLSSAERTQETNSAYRTITFPNGSVLKIRFSDHTPGRTARELDDDRVNVNGINWTHTGRSGESVEGYLDISRNRMTADDVVRFVDRMAEYDRDGYPEEMQRLIEENKERIKNEHRGVLMPEYYVDERITKAFGEDVEPLVASSEKGKNWRERKYTISDKEADGRKFYQNEEGNIDLVHPREDALREAKIPIIPFRLTPSMVNHIWRRHRRELRLKDKSQAASFAVNVMENFDHIRKGDRDKTYVFSIENGRTSVGMRAIGIVVDSESGDFLGTVSSGYENMQNLKEREQLWGESAKEKSPTDTASVNVSTVPVQQGGELVGSASNQSISSGDKGSEKFGTAKENGEKKGENLVFREAEDEAPTRPSGPLREGETIFDRAEAVSRDYLAELDRSRKEALAAKPKSHCANSGLYGARLSGDMEPPIAWQN